MSYVISIDINRICVGKAKSLKILIHSTVHGYELQWDCK